jgi:hypothetical protein
MLSQEVEHFFARDISVEGIPVFRYAARRVYARMCACVCVYSYMYT